LENTYRLVSLWDIVKLFDAFDLCGSLVLLDSFCSMHSFVSDEGRGGLPANADSVSKLVELFESIVGKCSKNGFKRCFDTASEAKLRLEHGALVDVSTIVAQVEHVRFALLLEFRNRKFLRVETERFQWVDHPELFGPHVNRVFPLAQPDIREVGNCMAAECSTAAVFHLMRVAEYGLRKLAARLRVHLTHSGAQHPIEFADWQKVIDGIKNEITKAQKLGPGPKRQAKLEAYSDAADHCLYMKDIWRNNISHARKPYNDIEAMAILERVREFMTFLATKLLASRV
jgi:hypothetical protein